MRGVHQAKAAILGYLQQNIGPYCAAIEADEGLTPGTVPVPANFINGPERPVNVIPGRDTKYPVIFIDEGAEVAAVDWLDRSAGDPIFEVVYNLRVICWVSVDRKWAYDEATLQRDRLDLAIKSCLMDKPTIIPRVLRVAIESFRSEYSEPWEDTPGKPCSASRVSFSVRQVEDLVRPLLVDAASLTETVVVNRLP